MISNDVIVSPDPSAPLHHRALAALGLNPYIENNERLIIDDDSCLIKVDSGSYLVYQLDGDKIVTGTAFTRAMVKAAKAEVIAEVQVVKVKESTLATYDCWKVVEAILGASERTLLHGVPGTGKTRAGMTLGMKDQQKRYNIVMTPETPAAELRGFYIPQGDHFVWQDGPAVSAWRCGGRLVLNEIDQASSDCVSLLLAILDDAELAELVLPTGEVIHPTPGFSVVATMNGEPDDLLSALRDRFPVTVKIDKVNPGAIAALPKDLQKAATGTGTLLGDRRISVRAWAQFARLRERGIDEEMAALACFGDRGPTVLNSIRIGRGE